MSHHRTNPIDYFSDYRAEWSKNLFQKYFIPPQYLDKLEKDGPVFLIGGRGTGKTTALRSLEYDVLCRSKGCAKSDLPFYGVYIRVDKNYVRAFEGPEIEQRQWQRLFAHYFNLLLAREVAELALWIDCEHDVKPSVVGAFGATGRMTPKQLLGHIEQGISDLEIYINNPNRCTQPILTMALSPVRALADWLSTVALQGRIIFCCIDEYENLADDQQAIVNTFIKHAEPPLSYKVGLRKNGLRVRHTIDSNDELSTPADYVEIDIAQVQSKHEHFLPFARRVLETRLSLMVDGGINVPKQGEQFLIEMSRNDEVKNLGGQPLAEKFRMELVTTSDQSVASWAQGQDISLLSFLAQWAEKEGITAREVANDFRNSGGKWAKRWTNYETAALYWLSRSRKGTPIRKYYSGFKTLIFLSSGNIRFFIELIDESVIAETHVSKTGGSKSDFTVSPHSQTSAARLVAERRLKQIESLGDRGGELKRLVLVLGRVFFEFARDPNKAPETNTFVLSGTLEDRARAKSLLSEGVAQLVLEAFPRTKATTPLETREDDEYRIHPIFCPYFNISYRKKRRATFDAGALMRSLTEPREGLKELLGSTSAATDDDLPDQLALFLPFYEGSST